MRTIDPITVSYKCVFTNPNSDAHFNNETLQEKPILVCKEMFNIKF